MDYGCGGGLRTTMIFGFFLANFYQNYRVLHVIKLFGATFKKKKKGPDAKFESNLEFRIYIQLESNLESN